jgi:hypothetical protein
MCWKKIEEYIKIFNETEYISIVNPAERKFVIHAIAEEFPEIPRVRIAATVDRGIKHFEKPIKRNAFIRFMQTSL